MVTDQIVRPSILGRGPKGGGVEFINFLDDSFRSEICSEQSQLLESGVKSKRVKREVLELKNFMI